MALVVQGDAAAFAVLYERHLGAASALATRMCSTRPVAEEVVQDAFLSFWRGRRHFDRTRGSVRAWVLGIVRNRAIDVLRQNVTPQPIPCDNGDFEDLLDGSALAEVSGREHAHEIRVALAGLPPEQSRVIVLAYYGGYTHAEIAALLQTPIGTVKGRIRLGLRKMAHSLPTAA